MHSPCPIRGCNAPAKPTQPLCDAHWRQVPKELRNQIKRHLRRVKHGQPHNVITAAVAIIHQQERADETTVDHPDQ